MLQKHSSKPVLHNYFDPNKLFLNLYLIKFLVSAAKLFFSCPTKNMDGIIK